MVESRTTETSPHALDSEQVLAQLGTDAHGLDDSEAGARLVTNGPNALPRPTPPGLASLFVGQFRSPLIYVLMAAGALAFALRQTADAVFIGVVLLLNAVIGTVQEHGAERSAEALRKLVPERAIVLRRGEQHEIDVERLVPGDVVILESGSKVPVDARLLSAVGLEVDESLLTGESASVAKAPDAVLGEETPVADRTNMVFAGAMVLRGRGHAVAVATGPRTQLGTLAQSLGATGRTKPPLLQRMERFSKRIAVAVGVAVVVVGTAAQAQGMPLATVFLLCVALAVSAIPEGLPVALTVALAIGTRRMSRRNVIVRRLVAVESLGSCTFVASDKTGTLTMNELTVTHVALPGERAWPVTGAGTSPEGMVEPARELDVGTAAKMIARLAESAVLCNDAFLGRRGDDWTHHGDAVDVALLALGHKVGLLRTDIEVQRPLAGAIPFESEHRFAATLNRAGDHLVTHVKGALERLLPMCETMMTAGGDVPLDPDAIAAQATMLAQGGHRVLAFASGRVSLRPGETFGPEQLRGLCFLGLVAMTDPLRPEAKAAVLACRKAGVDVAMVTGDHPVTALAIARELELAESVEQVVTGAELREAARAGAGALDALNHRA